MARWLRSERVFQGMIRLGMAAWLLPLAFAYDFDMHRMPPHLVIPAMAIAAAGIVGDFVMRWRRS